MKNAGKLFLVFILGAAASAALLTGERWPPRAPRSTARPSPKERPVPLAKRASIRGAIAAKSDAIQRCYETHLASEPAIAAGSLRVSWKIEADGAVRDVAAIASDFSAPAFEECVLGRVRSWTFAGAPEPTRVAHRFIFRQRTPASMDFE